MGSTPDVSVAGRYWRRSWPLGLMLLGAAAVAWPLLALPAAFACFIGALALPRRSGGRERWLLLAAALGSSVGLFRFILTEAMPGIVGGGRRAVQQHAVSRLREVLFAQDAMRRAGWIDPDADGVGSAAFLSELCGGPPLRGQPRRETPVLSCGELIDTPLGPAARSGAYLYTVCLPQRAGGWSADPQSAVDEERAERSFVAYAWPQAATTFDRLFFIDQNENILTAAPAPPGTSEAARGLGLTCEAALGAAKAQEWAPWRDKKPRPGPLPGSTNPAGNRPSSDSAR